MVTGIWNIAEHLMAQFALSVSTVATPAHYVIWDDPAVVPQPAPALDLSKLVTLNLPSRKARLHRSPRSAQPDAQSFAALAASAQPEPQSFAVLAASAQPEPQSFAVLAASAKPKPQSFVVFAGGAGPLHAEVPRAADGLFYLDALVNGVSVRFLVDTGSTSVVLTSRDALRVGIDAKLDAAAQRAQTAGGSVAMARVKLARLVAGPASGEDVEAAVTDSSLGVSLLGQSWLARFDSVTIRRDRMILE
jgi:aspartyl protease family protein